MGIFKKRETLDELYDSETKAGLKTIIKPSKELSPDDPEYRRIYDLAQEEMYHNLNFARLFSEEVEEQNGLKAFLPYITPILCVIILILVATK